MRNGLADAGKTQRSILSVWVGTAFVQDDATAAREQWRDVADQMRSRVPTLAGLMDAAEPDVLPVWPSRSAPREATPDDPLVKTEW